MEPSYLVTLRADATKDLEASGLTAVVILAGTPQRTELGGVSSTPTDGEEYPCRVQYDTSPKDQPDGGGKRTGSASWLIFLPWDAAVKASNKLRIAGKTYEVKGTNGNESDRLTLDVSATTAD